VTAARLPLQNAVLRDLLTNERLRSLKLESAQLLLKGWRGIGRARASSARDLFTNELLKRGCGLSLDSLKSFVVAGRDCRQVSVRVGRFTIELVGRGRWLSLDSLQSLLTGGIVLLVAVFIIVGRFANELFMRGCTRVVLNAGSRNRAVE
jgi:hypothetical protein